MTASTARRSPWKSSRSARLESGPERPLSVAWPSTVLTMLSITWGRRREPPGAGGPPPLASVPRARSPKPSTICAAVAGVPGGSRRFRLSGSATMCPRYSNSATQVAGDLLRSSRLAGAIDRRKQCKRSQVEALAASSASQHEHTVEEYPHAYWHSKVVQRRQGVWFHHPRRRRQGPVRPSHRHQRRGLPFVAGGLEGPI